MNSGRVPSATGSHLSGDAPDGSSSLRDFDPSRSPADPTLDAWELAEERKRADLFVSKLNEAEGYATRLAQSLSDKHYPNPNWRPLPDLYGVLTQIDNMTTGLAREPKISIDTALAALKKEFPGWAYALDECHLDIHAWICPDDGTPSNGYDGWGETMAEAILDAIRAARAAQGTEARSAETSGLGPKGNGPVAESDAPSRLLAPVAVTEEADHG